MGQYKRKLKTKGLRWYYSFQYLGAKVHSKCIYKTKQEAARAEREKRAELDEEARNPSKKDVTLLELFSHRLDQLELVRNQEYFRDNKRLCKQIIATWGNIKASDVSRQMVHDIIMAEIQRCKKEKLGNSRPNQLLKVLKASLNYANNVFELDIRNPCDGISKLPEDAKIKFIPTDEMILAVKAKCNDPQKELIDFVYETAARVGEAVALDYEDVNDDHVVLYSRKSRNSARLPRFVPRPDFIKPNGKGKVFKDWNAYPRFLEDKVEECKQTKWNWHGLRHRRASIWAHEGKPLFELQMLLGHTQISTTQRYLHSLGIVRL